jgi:hypothetical protein
MVQSFREGTDCWHDAYIWLRRDVMSGWVNVLVSTVLNGMETGQRQRLIRCLETWEGGEQPRFHPLMEDLA